MPRKRSNDLDEDGDVKKQKKSFEPINVNSNKETQNEILSPIYGLTLYEVHRIPRHPVANESTTTIQVRNLNIELTCPVCLGILHDTMTVMECLHRFCSGCISKSLRLGKKECPTCRVKLPSKRYLRPDPNFDALISSIYPNLDEYEAKQDSIIQEINKNLMKSKNLIQSIEQGKKRQALAKTSRVNKKESNSNFDTPTPKKTKSKSENNINNTSGKKTNNSNSKRETYNTPPKTSPNTTNNNNNTTIIGNSNLTSPTTPLSNNALNNTNINNNNNNNNNNNGTSPSVDNQGPEISFILMKHAAEKVAPQLSNRYLRTSRLLTIRHLCKFLAKKLGESDYKVYRIYLPNQSLPLSEDLTLDVIDREIWKKPQEELELWYQMV